MLLGGCVFSLHSMVITLFLNFKKYFSKMINDHDQRSVPFITFQDVRFTNFNIMFKGIFFSSMRTEKRKLLFSLQCNSNPYSILFNSIFTVKHPKLGLLIQTFHLNNQNKNKSFRTTNNLYFVEQFVLCRKNSISENI